MKNLLIISLALAVITGCGNSQTEKQVSNEQIQELLKSSRPCKPQTNDRDWYASDTKAPLFEGLDGIDFKISTSNAESQKYFNQGMMLSYGFNHAEAARSFYQAIRLDSTCAMCYWGFAYVLGPNYNAGMEEDNFERAYEASRKAQSLSSNASEKEKAMINALQARYAENPPEDRSELDIAYSSAMKKVYQKFPDDADVGALYAESMMDLHPWDLYDKKTSAPKAWTPEIVSVLEKQMKKYPKHPGAHHFYIHAVEASAHPERGLPSAKLMETLVPGSGHLVHMPSHIYINTGHYHEGSLSNLAAVKVDSGYVSACNAQGAYPLAYYPHNYHFLTATATLEGNSALAWTAAKKVQSNTATDIMREPGWGTLQHYYTIPYYVAVKFALWDTILAMPSPDLDLAYPRAIWHYARGMALVGKNDLREAERELDSLELLSRDSILKTLTIWDVNSMEEIAQIAIKVLHGQINLANRNDDAAIDLFEAAVDLEDNLNYDEPPDWFFSVRHYLGRALMKATKYGKAEKVYEKDLEVFPDNGWALSGLYDSLLKQGETKKAQKVKERLDEAFKYADIRLSSSVLL